MKLVFEFANTVSFAGKKERLALITDNDSKKGTEGGDGEHRLWVFVGIPPVACREISCSWMFTVVRWWLSAFLSSFIE